MRISGPDRQLFAAAV